MTDFRYTPYLRSAHPIAMETMHFHIAQTNIFWGTKIFLHLGGPNEHHGTHEKLSWRCKVGQISSRGNIRILYLLNSYSQLVLQHILSISQYRFYFESLILCSLLVLHGFTGKILFKCTCQS